MKIGDLICYNAAGQRSKTIGIYLGEQIVRAPYWRTIPCVTVYKIFWLVFGEVLPRALQSTPVWDNTTEYTYTTKVVKGQGLYYHEDYGCFEIIKKSS
jgi:hypothetical protein